MQAVMLRQINRSHADAFPSSVALIVRFDGVAPELARLQGTVVEARVDQKVAVFRVRFEVGRGILYGPAHDDGLEDSRGVPAA